MGRSGEVHSGLGTDKLVIDCNQYTPDIQERKWSRSVVSDCNLVDCSPPGSSVHGILQVRVLEWVAISFSRGSSGPRDRTQVTDIAGRGFNLWATRTDPWHTGDWHKNTINALVGKCQHFIIKSMMNLLKINLKLAVSMEM